MTRNVFGQCGRGPVRADRLHGSSRQRPQPYAHLPNRSVYIRVRHGRRQKVRGAAIDIAHAGSPLAQSNWKAVKMTASTSGRGNPVLVMGATGRHGNTGQYIVRRLIDEGRNVRVLVRATGERTAALADLGAEVVVADLHDRRSLLPALQDVDVAYFTYPITRGVIPAAANYAAAVREVGRNPRTVVMSMVVSNPNHPSPLGQDQWVAEEVLQWAGLDVLIMRIAAVFYQNLIVLHSQSVRDHGTMRNSFGSGPVPWIDGGDAAELAVTALLHPERFEGSVVYPLGADAASHVDVANILSELLRRPVRFDAITPAAWTDDILRLSRTDEQNVVNDAMAVHIPAVGQSVAESGAALPVNPAALRAQLGREPVTMNDFLRANLAAFT